jgi:hypothetical protein
MFRLRTGSPAQEAAWGFRGGRGGLTKRVPLLAGCRRPVDIGDREVLP